MAIGILFSRRKNGIRVSLNMHNSLTSKSCLNLSLESRSFSVELVFPFHCDLPSFTQSLFFSIELLLLLPPSWSPPSSACLASSIHSLTSSTMGQLRPPPTSETSYCRSVPLHCSAEVDGIQGEGRGEAIPQHRGSHTKWKTVGTCTPPARTELRDRM